MKILFLLPDFPFPASTGGRLKVFNLLKHMSPMHQCDILCFGKPDKTLEESFQLQMPKVNVIGVLPLKTGFGKWFIFVANFARLLPPSFAMFSSHEYRNAIRQACASCTYDVIHYDIINMAQYAYICEHVASVHSPNDATSLVYMRVTKDLVWGLKKLYYLVSIILLRRFEKKNYHSFTKVHVVSLPDARYLLGLDSNIDVTVIPISSGQVNGEARSGNSHPDIVPTRSLRVICTASFENHAIADPIYDFVQTFWPRVRGAFSDVEFVILGKNIPDTMLLVFQNTPGVKVLTWVDDYSAFLSTADVVLVPDRVGPNGAKTRTLEAMGLKL
ncbi:MAG: glycosyltransferase, partial [Glaciimonas sp.]|nr:glycosyltransferase [Glaciimonas sp.]